MYATFCGLTVLKLLQSDHRRNHGSKSGGDEPARPEGPKLEARRAESGNGVLGEGAASPLSTS